MPDLPDLIGNEFFQMDIAAYNRVANQIRAAVAAIPEKAAGITYDWAQDTRRVLKSTRYAKKRIGQKYKRTGRLASSWRATKRKHGATILNTAHKRGRFYSRYVVGNAQGKGIAAIHQGRWTKAPWPARRVVDGELEHLRIALADAVKKEIEGGT